MSIEWECLLRGTMTVKLGEDPEIFVYAPGTPIMTSKEMMDFTIGLRGAKRQGYSAVPGMRWDRPAFIAIFVKDFGELVARGFLKKEGTP